MHRLVQVEESHQRPIPWWWQVTPHWVLCAAVQKLEGQAAAGAAGTSTQIAVSRRADANQRSFFFMGWFLSESWEISGCPRLGCEAATAPH